MTDKISFPEMTFNIETIKVDAASRAIKATWVYELDPVTMRITPPKKWSWSWIKLKIRSWFARDMEK
jgi:hypothetical protein